MLKILSGMAADILSGMAADILSGMAADITRISSFEYVYVFMSSYIILKR
jgi:hypothetical protein